MAIETVNNKIKQLPPRQLEWLLSIKNQYGIPFYKDFIITKELIASIKLRAKEYSYLEIGLIDSDDLYKYFIN